MSSYFPFYNEIPLLIILCPYSQTVVPHKLTGFRTAKESKAKMPLENLEDEGLEKNPNLDLAQKKFMLTTNEYRDDSKLKKELLGAIEQDSKCRTLYHDKGTATQIC